MAFQSAVFISADYPADCYWLVHFFTFFWWSSLCLLLSCTYFSLFYLNSCHLAATPFPCPASPPSPTAPKSGSFRMKRARQVVSRPSHLAGVIIIFKLQRDCLLMPVRGVTEIAFWISYAKNDVIFYAGSQDSSFLVCSCSSVIVSCNGNGDT